METLCKRHASGVLPERTALVCCMNLLCSTTDSANRVGWNLLLDRLATSADNSAVKQSRESFGFTTTFRHSRTRRSLWTCSLAFVSPVRIMNGLTTVIKRQPRLVSRNQSDPTCSTNSNDALRFSDVNGSHAIIDRISNTIAVTTAFFSASRVWTVGWQLNFLRIASDGVDWLRRLCTLPVDFDVLLTRKARCATELKRWHRRASTRRIRSLYLLRISWTVTSSTAIGQKIGTTIKAKTE